MTGDYLEILLEWEGPPANRVCCLCNGDDAQKCHDCLSKLILCTKCCRMQHAQLPFHQISQWNGDFFERTMLMNLGVEIHLGHGGQTCPHHYWDWEDTNDGGPSAASSAAGTPGACETGDIDSEGPSASAYTRVPQDIDDMGERDIFLENKSPAYPNDFPAVGKTQITVVNTLGVHTISIRPDKQLFEMGLFPASFTHPKTAFTLGLLDDFILDNLECGTSAMNYYSKLWHITSSVFPHLVPDQYQELMRVARQWRQLKLLKWNGFGHDRRDPKDGELALFCPACPQPSINVTLLTQDDETTPGWLYSHSLVMDGNFKAEHLHLAHPEDEVWLTDGQSFMVARARYQAHLGMAKDSPQRSECNNHRAVNQANASQHKLEVTGIGGCTCTRHGCFVPNSMVDFQKGERQMNMDYALCNALSHNMDGLHRALTFYDINCQYNKHLQQWVDESLHLSIPPGMDIIPGIGLFLSQKYKEAKQGVAESTEAFDTLNGATDLEMVEWWEAQEGAAQASRMNDPSALNLYDVQLQKGKSGLFWDIMAVVLIDDFSSTNPEGGRGQAAADIFPITIEEMQIALAMETRRMGRHLTETQMLEIGHRRIRLQHSIDKFVAAAGRYLGEGYDADDCIPDMDIKFLDDGPDGSASTNEDIEDVRDPGDNHPKGLFRPEMVVIPLPSNLGIYRCELGAARLVRQETTLREGQANDMLHAIRVHLADKAVLFRTIIRPAKSQARTTRAWVQVHSMEQVINLNSMIYKKYQAQLSNLGADQLLEKYRVLEKSNLKATSAVADPNAQGQRNSTLPWFWSLDVQGDLVSNDWMNECPEHGSAEPTKMVTSLGWDAQMYRQLAKDAHARFAKVNPTFSHN
ncbi:hypothetical protein DFH29DRAFT_877228 [Suillus ampliporus]|nr:hypothetical protein DFH29DRAFT_877228 [Suillus ampliporus]